MIAGWSGLDSNMPALREIVAFWGTNPTDNSLAWYQTRIDVLSNIGTTSGFKLNQFNVIDDAELDVIYGVFNAAAGSIRRRNLYFAKTLAPGKVDSILSKTNDETATNTPNTKL